MFGWTTRTAVGWSVTSALERRHVPNPYSAARSATERPSAARGSAPSLSRPGAPLGGRLNSTAGAAASATVTTLSP
jgi:hypothetical protein